MFMFLFLFFSMLLLCSFFRLKELFQVKNGVTTSFLFFLKMPKIWVGRTTVNGEKQEDGLTEKRNASASRWYNNCSDDEKSSCFGKVMRCLLQNQKRCVTFLMCWLKCHAISIDI